MTATAVRTTTMLAILFAGIIIGGVLGAGIMAYAPSLWAKPAEPSAVAQQQETTTTTTTAVVPAAERDLVSLFKEVEGSVVQITSTISTVNNNIIINGNPLTSESTRLGSGFVYDAQGLIVTNNHVVDGASTVDVTFTSGNTYSAKVLGRDAYSDLAVLKITDEFTEKLEPLKIGNSTDLQVGDQVVAIGNPFGLSNTMTTGIVSQLGRLIPNEDNDFSIPDVIQTDAAINPGNSGGPLLDMQGEVIGVNSAIQSNTGSFSGIGFAISSSAVQRIVPALIKDGKYDHPWLGITGANLIPDIVEKLGLPKNSKGVLVTEVTAGGPAQKAGIQGTAFDRLGNNIRRAGDIVTAVDGHEVKRMEDIIAYLEQHTRPGDVVTLDLNRAGQHVQAHVHIEARPGPG
ncbi:S1C family serine protease [Nitrososphaera viennensis]|uniref:Protease Do-like 1, chloroplastic n=2 Tax=Nitrososphaera viennensis TaxID=1034015 RepID=A0A060HVI3_9ARCH|nr:trypsin-like peptidase domain-containing protein [Nitrososphaera viennensis]AIC17062.1 Protease Do-like 1, chloroplastic [Nitrososphaera viennensis EN76]UVS68955.1 trypsin-like peptidase domain-containing protein [Nitrososphaera viennensis]